MPGVSVTQAESTPKHLEFARRRWVHVVAWITWMVIFFALMVRTDYPDGFGIHTDRGKAGGIELFWYSPILLKHVSFWNLLLFLWMWVGAAALLYLTIAKPILASRNGKTGQ